jgi:2-keto-4-pentenoate hydratase
MEVQLARLRSALASGMPRTGWKVAINVPEVLRGLGLTHSGVGWLDGRRAYPSGAVVPCDPGADLRVEPEVCLRLASPVRSGESPEAALRCVDGAAPALELVDFARPSADLDAIVSHSIFHAGLVTGAWLPLDAAPELGGQWPRLEVSGQPVAPVRADLVPADFGELLVFVAVFLEVFGETLEAGDLVLSGSYAPRAVPIAPGSRIRADFGSLGEVAAAISDPGGTA